MYTQCLEGASNYLRCKQLVSQLPSHHRHAFNYIAAFLIEVLKHSEGNGVDAKILANIFGPVLLRDPPGSELGSSVVGYKYARQMSEVFNKKSTFIYHFLVDNTNESSV